MESEAQCLIENMIIIVFGTIVFLVLAVIIESYLSDLYRSIVNKRKKPEALPEPQKLLPMPGMSMPEPEQAKDHYEMCLENILYGYRTALPEEYVRKEKL